MAATVQRARANRQMQIRVQEQMRDLIDRAAALEGKSRSEFVIESAHIRATNVLLDQRFFQLGADQWDELIAVLDQPPKPNAALKSLMQSKAPWE